MRAGLQRLGHAAESVATQAAAAGREDEALPATFERVHKHHEGDGTRAEVAHGLTQQSTGSPSSRRRSASRSCGSSWSCRQVTRITPASRLEPAVASAIALEGVRRRVAGVAVELDDQPVLRPDAVDLVALDALIRLRQWKASLDEERLEALLQLAADHVQAKPGFVKESPDGRNARSSWVAVHKVA